MVSPDDKPRWKVSQHRKTHQGTVWTVHEPDGSYSAHFASWGEAMDYATNIGTRVEHWLERQR